MSLKRAVLTCPELGYAEAISKNPRVKKLPLKYSGEVVNTPFGRPRVKEQADFFIFCKAIIIIRPSKIDLLNEYYY